MSKRVSFTLSAIVAILLITPTIPTQAVGQAIEPESKVIRVEANNNETELSNSVIKGTELAQELKFRSEFGLDVSDSVVKENIQKHSKGKFGAYLSPEEELEIEERLQFQDEVIPKIKAMLSLMTADDYVLYIDQRGGGIINIGLKDTASDLKEIRKLFSDEKKLKVYKIGKSEKELDKLHEKLWDSRNELLGEGIEVINVSTDVVNGKIIVGVRDVNEEKREKLNKQYGELLDVREADIASDDADRSSTWNPMQAGAKITYSNAGSNYKCSVGFMASDGLNKYVVTAGHCKPATSTQFYQGTTSLGQMPYKNQSGNSDAGLIGGGPSNVTYQGGKIYLTSTTTGQYNMTQNASEDVVGEAVCMSGASSNTNPVTCGTILNKNYSATISGFSFTKLRTASYTSNGGDSGGIVYNGSKLKGVDKGHTGSGDAIYSHMQYVLSDLSAVSGMTISVLF
jgi:hypothetical protein